MPDHGTGIYWLSGMASGARRSLAAVVAAGVVSASAASPAAAHRRAAGRSLHAFRPHQLPVRIARGGIPGECPDIGDISDLVGAALDHGAGLVAGRRDHLRDEADGKVGDPIALLGAGELRLVDGDEAGL